MYVSQSIVEGVKKKGDVGDHQRADTHAGSYAAFARPPVETGARLEGESRRGSRGGTTTRATSPLIHYIMEPDVS